MVRKANLIKMGASTSSRKNLQNSSETSTDKDKKDSNMIDEKPNDKATEPITDDVSDVEFVSNHNREKPNKTPNEHQRADEDAASANKHAKNDVNSQPTGDQVEIIGAVDEFETYSNQPADSGNKNVFQKSSQNINSKNCGSQKQGSLLSDVENLEGEESLEAIESARSAEQSKADVNILLIGLVGSGKTTLKKHMQLSLGKGYSIDDRKEYRRLIRRYILQQSLELVLENWSYLNSLESDDRKPFTQFMQYCINKEIKIRPYIPLCNHTQEALKTLWSEKRFQEMYHNNPVWRDTSLDLFCARCTEIGNDGYLPTDTDIIRYYGCLEKHKTLYVEINKPKTLTVEVSEFRQPKSQQLKSCNAAMFFVDISQIDTDHHKCSLKAALKSFNSVINQKELENKTVFLFFTKQDVLAAKLNQIDLKSIFPGLKKDASCDKVCEQVLKMFQERCDERHIHHFFMNALDFGKSQEVLQEVFKFVHSNLK